MGLNFLNRGNSDTVEADIRLVPKNWDMDDEEPEIEDPVELEIQEVN